MPTYEYSCQKCGITFELFQSMRDAPLKICTCGKKGKVKRLVGRGAGIIFKGSGFYETDYKRRPVRPAADKSDGQGAGKAAGAATSSPKGDATTPTAKATPGKK
jgi:putative FmdB family regulatory protein